MAPRRSEIDLVELEKLCQLQCTDVEIAAWFGVSTRTIERRRQETDFTEVMERGKAKGRISVRRMQMKLLEQGNATMGVWLGKQILGQVDQGSIAIQTTRLPSLREMTPEETAKVLAAMNSKEIRDLIGPIDAEYSVVPAEQAEKLPLLAVSNGDGTGSDGDA